jgi:hypothetical protein
LLLCLLLSDLKTLNCSSTPCSCTETSWLFHTIFVLAPANNPPYGYHGQACRIYHSLSSLEHLTKKRATNNLSGYICSPGFNRSCSRSSLVLLVLHILRLLENHTRHMFLTKVDGAMRWTPSRALNIEQLLLSCTADSTWKRVDFVVF